MIHWRKEGEHFKLGLNIMFARGHFSVCWAWYDFARNEGSMRGLDVSRRGIRRRSARWNVVQNFLAINDLALVHTEVLQDLVSEQDWSMRVNERISFIRPRNYH
jgi:hypothetical protein